MNTRDPFQRKGIFRYPGSKNRVATNIISYFPDHQTYVDVFGGSAALLLRKAQSRIEIYNDLNSELTNFFKVLCYNFDEFKEKAKFLVNSREWFYQLKKQEITAKDNIERAVNTYYHFKFGYIGRRAGWSIYINQHSTPKINIDFLERVHNRLKGIQITNFEYKEIISRASNASTFFYLDPPYPKVGKDLYQMDFDSEDFENYLSEISDPWILSYPNKLSTWFNLPIKIHYSLGKQKTVTEYLISNFELVRNTDQTSLEGLF